MVHTTSKVATNQGKLGKNHKRGSSYINSEWICAGVESGKTLGSLASCTIGWKLDNTADALNGLEVSCKQAPAREQQDFGLKSVSGLEGQITELSISRRCGGTSRNRHV